MLPFSIKIPFQKAATGHRAKSREKINNSGFQAEKTPQHGETNLGRIPLKLLQV